MPILILNRVEVSCNNKPKKKKNWEKLVKEKNKVNKSKMKPGA